MVLASVISFLQSAAGSQHLCPDNPQVAHIVVRSQCLRLVSRLSVRIHMTPTVLRNHVLVAVKQIGRIPFNRLRHAPYRVRGQQIVVVAQRGVLPVSQGNRRVRVSGDSQISFSVNNPESCILPGNLRQRLPGFRPVAFSVVENCLPPLIGLRFQALRQFPQKTLFRIIDRDYNADQPRLRRMSPLPLQFFFIRLLPFPFPVPCSEHHLPRLLPDPANRVADPVSCRIFPQPRHFAHFLSCSRPFLIFLSVLVS